MLQEQNIIRVEPDETVREPYTAEQEDILLYLGDGYDPGSVVLYASANVTGDGKTLREEAEDTSRALGYVLLGVSVFILLLGWAAYNFIT